MYVSTDGVPKATLRRGLAPPCTAVTAAGSAALFTALVPALPVAGVLMVKLSNRWNRHIVGVLSESPGVTWLQAVLLA